MGVITEFKIQKCKTRSNVYLDGKFVCGLELQTIVKNGLKVGLEISEERLENIQIESEVERAFEKALSLVERQKYTKVAISRKLKEKGFVPSVIESVLGRLEEYGYISDEDFAKSYISAYPTKSMREVESKLMQKGIDKNIVRAVLEDCGAGESEQEKCNAVAEKYMRGKERSGAVAKKLTAHLAYKGFNFTHISNAVKKYSGEDIEVDD